MRLRKSARFGVPFLAAVVGAVAGFGLYPVADWAFPKAPAHKQVPSMGQLIHAAMAYDANQADLAGLTVRAQTLVGSPVIQKDGRAVVKLRVVMADGREFAVAVLLQHALWIGRDYTVARVR